MTLLQRAKDTCESSDLVYATPLSSGNVRRIVCDLLVLVEEQRKKILVLKATVQDFCPCHVASDTDPKVCARCGISVDELRPEVEKER